MRIVPTAIILLLMGGAGVFAESQPPTPSPLISSDKPQNNLKRQQSEADNRQQITNTPPLTVNAKERQQHTSDFKENKEGKTTTDWWLVRFTGVLALFAILQCVVMWIQARRLSDTVEATEKAAKAAQKSAEFLPLIERAYVFVGADLMNGHISLNLTNHGKTPAILSKVFARWSVQKTCPSEVDKDVFDIISEGIIVSGGDPYVVKVRPRMDTMDWISIEHEEETLFCYGLIEYKDVLGATRKTGFCWGYEYIATIDSGRFNISDSPLNYYN